MRSDRPGIRSAQHRAALKRSGFLTEQREFDLARRARAGDEKAFDELVMAYEPMVIATVARAKPGKPIDPDRYQVAMAALTHAARRFDPDMGLRLSASAKYWIRKQLWWHDTSQSSDLNLGQGNGMRAARMNTLRACERLGLDPDKHLTDAEVRQICGLISTPKNRVNEYHVRGFLESGKDRFSTSLDECVGRGEEPAADADDDEDAVSVAERDARLDLMHEAVDRLGPVDADIVRLNLLADKPLAVTKVLARHGVKAPVAKARQAAMEALERAMRDIAASRGVTV